MDAVKEYKEKQIIKHALQHYITRPGASKKDLHTERILLSTYEEDVKKLQERYGIKPKSKGGAKDE